jgi:hypothetical protein
MRIAVRRFNLTSLAKFGCVLGAALALVPSLICGLAGMAVARLGYSWLDRWQEIPISVLGREVTRIDLVQVLGLEGVLRLLQVLTAASLPVLLLWALSLTLVGGTVLALMVLLAGIIYNWVAAATGGLVVETVNPGDTRPNP